MLARRKGLEREVPLPSPWTAGAVLVASLVLLPVVAVLWLALFGEPAGGMSILAAALPRYVRTTAGLMLGVGLLAAMIGTGAAWLVTMYRFPLSRVIEWALLLPLAVPSYVAAYALVDFLEYAGPVQSALRNAFGWKSAADYPFPQVRSFPVAVIVMAATLYPYVYFLTRASLREQSGGVFEAARSMGAGPLARFWRIGLPLARPAVAAATAVVMMETVNDFGTVDYFAVQTLTLGIFTLWLEAYDIVSAARLAVMMLFVVLMLVSLERWARARRRTHQGARRVSPVAPEPLHGWKGLLAAALCLLPVLAGFVLPVGVMVSHAISLPGAWADPRLVHALRNTLLTGGTAAVITVGAAVLLTYGLRLSGRSRARWILPATLVGYAVPGAVLAIGILAPVSWFDHRLADLWTALRGTDPGLLLTGSAAVLVYAYSVRFFAIAQGGMDAALGRLPPSLPMVARTLGHGPAGVLRRVHLPLMRGSAGAALVLVFVDCVKELPATMLLRPFNFDTLATLLHEQASLEQVELASPPALIITAVGGLAVLLAVRPVGR